MLQFISRAAVAGVLTLMTGTAAFAAPTPPPVNVASCEFRKLAVVNDEGVPGPAPIDINTLWVTFVNQAPLAATDVRFAVQYAHRSQVIDAQGTFSSGVSILKEFTPTTTAQYNGSASCSVQSVTFSDGSTWSAV